MKKNTIRDLQISLDELVRAMNSLALSLAIFAQECELQANHMKKQLRKGVKS